MTTEAVAFYGQIVDHGSAVWKALDKPSDHQPSFVMPVAGAALLLLAAYVGVYYATVEPYGQQIGATWRFEVLPVYPRLNGDFASPGYQRWRRFFAPVHQLDRQFVRSRKWEILDLTPAEHSIQINSLGR